MFKRGEIQTGNIFRPYARGMEWYGRLKEAMDERGWSMAELARRSGVPYDSINKYLRGDIEQPRGDTIDRLAKAIERDPLWLREGLEKSNAVIGEKIQREPGWEPPTFIPLYGQAVGGEHGEFVLNGNKLADILAPPSLSHTHGAYAVSVAGDSMSPRYEDGETVFVDPRKRVIRGDYVVVQIQTHEEGPLLAYVKRFLRHTDKELVLEQFNPPKELRFPHRQVVSVDFVALGGRTS